MIWNIDYILKLSVNLRVFVKSFFRNLNSHLSNIDKFYMLVSLYCAGDNFLLVIITAISIREDNWNKAKYEAWILHLSPNICDKSGRLVESKLLHSFQAVLATSERLLTSRCATSVPKRRKGKCVGQGLDCMQYLIFFFLTYCINLINSSAVAFLLHLTTTLSMLEIRNTCKKYQHITCNYFSSWFISFAWADFPSMFIIGWYWRLCQHIN